MWRADSFNFFDAARPVWLFRPLAFWDIVKVLISHACCDSLSSYPLPSAVEGRCVLRRRRRACATGNDSILSIGLVAVATRNSNWSVTGSLTPCIAFVDFWHVSCASHPKLIFTPVRCRTISTTNLLAEDNFHPRLCDRHQCQCFL